MKKFLLKINIALLITLLMVVSCNDFLDVAPHNKVSNENALETIADFEMAVLDPVTNLRNNYDYILMYDVMSDNLILNQSGRLSYGSFYRWQTMPSNTNSGAWSSWYNSILISNHIITRLESPNFENIASTVRGKNVFGAAYAMRGMFHFLLVRDFGKNYSIATDSDLGVPYKKDILINQPARNTVKDVYKWAIEDLEKALTLMSDSYNTNNLKDNAYITKKAVNATLARIYLTMAGDKNDATAQGYLQKVVTYASAAIKGDGSDIATREQFLNMWTGANAIPEFIWRLSVIETDDQLAGNLYGQSGTNSEYRNEYNCSYSFTQMFQASDIRTTAYLSKGDVYQNNNYIGIKKYRSRVGSADRNRVDIPFIRTSEMYLARAEANARLGSPTLVREDLTRLMSNRYSTMPQLPANDADLINVVYNERRLELAFEGHRWHDIKRLNQKLVRDEKGDKANGTGVPSPFTEKLATDKYWLFPIPLTEMQANLNMVQNDYSN